MNPITECIFKARNELRATGWQIGALDQRGTEVSTELFSPDGYKIMVAANLDEDSAFANTVCVAYEAGARKPIYAAIIEDDLHYLGLASVAMGAAQKAAMEGKRANVASQPKKANQPQKSAPEGFLQTLDKVLVKLRTRGWKVDKDVDESGENYGLNFEDLPGASADSTVIQWALTAKTNYGVDVQWCQDANYVKLMFDAGWGIDTRYEGLLEDMSMSEDDLMEAIVKMAQDSAEANA